MGRSQAFFTVDILSDDEEDASCALSPRHYRTKRKWPENSSGGNGESDPPFVVIDDDPTPQKRNPVCTPSVVAETPLSFGSDASIVKCSLARTHSREKFAGRCPYPRIVVHIGMTYIYYYSSLGISSLICLDSDNESEGGSSRGTLKESRNMVELLGRTACHSRSPIETSRLDSTSENEHAVLFCRMKDVACEDDLVITTATAKPYSSNGYAGISDFIKMSGDSPPSEDCLAEDLVAQARHDNDGDGNNYLRQSPIPVKQAGKQRAPNADKDISKIGAAARKKQLKGEKARLIEERKQKRQEEKLQKEALKAEAAELKKLEKEKQKWEKGKFALKSIIAEIDAKVLENGSIGGTPDLVTSFFFAICIMTTQFFWGNLGHLLARFAERGLSYRITSNPIEKSILWKITVPEQIAQVPMAGSKVEVFEGEIEPLKFDFVEKILDFENQFSSVHEKIHGMFAIMEEIMRKILEAQTKLALSEARGATDSQGSGENPNLIRRGEDHEVEILEGKKGMPPLEHIPREETCRGTSSPHHTPVTHFSASFVETNRGHHYSRDHLSFSNLRVAAPPCRSLPSLDGRTSLGSSVGSVHYDSPLRPTHNHPSQPLASPDLDPASVNLIENRIRKEMSPEPETECIHFVDANDITDDKGFFEDETEVTKLDSLYDLNPDLGVLEPLDLDTLVHLDPNDIKDIPLDKVCLDDINLISKEADLTLNPLKLSSEDSDFIISPNKTTPNNSGLILNNSDVNNLESEVSQLDLLHELDPNLIDPESFELRVITKHDPIENINMSSEDSNLNLKDSEPNFNNEPPLTLLDPNLGVAPLDLHLKESVLPDWADHITPPTDLNENISPHFHVVPTSTLDTLPRLLSPIPTGDSLGYVIMFESDDPSSYHTPDSYILPTTSLSFPVKDLPSPSWLTLLDHLTTPRRLSVTLGEIPYGDALLAKDVFIAPPTPVPLNRETFCPLILRLLSNMMSDVPYILLLYQAEEFCDLVVSESLIDHVHTVRSQYPLFTICYLTNKLMSFINKCVLTYFTVRPRNSLHGDQVCYSSLTSFSEQSHYKNSSNFNGYKRPPVEEVLAKLLTHFTKVHSRQCIDEAEIADHIVGLTSSLANCQFRKKLTWLSVNANGSIISKNFIDKNLIKNNVCCPLFLDVEAPDVRKYALQLLGNSLMWLGSVLYCRGHCEGVQQCAVELSLQGHPVECEVADLRVKDEWSFLCQLVHRFDVIEDASLAEEGESRYEDVRVEHLRALVDLGGDESLPVVLASVVEFLVGVEGSHSEIPPSFECDPPKMGLMSLLQQRSAPQAEMRQILGVHDLWTDS
ncbi:hypothetical protein M5K25_014067 [Dendrobium thyrsiflorum]|uniref:Uncharacterized protein n=1 Tax=Dendrobium thyrsiflorum TaxID=117978 RepID=A0ABD0UV12_DENTH